jgi:isoquinoline 1-oxidoreductase beta subunit
VPLGTYGRMRRAIHRAGDRLSATRRAFLQSGSGFALAFCLPEILKPTPTGVFEPNAFIRITSDNAVTLWVSRSEMGPGVRTNLPAVLAEELEVESRQSKDRASHAGNSLQGDPFAHQRKRIELTHSVLLSRAGAAAREMLISAAAESWGVERSACRAELGSVVHQPSGRKLAYGDLAGLAAKQAVPTAPPLKDPKDFRLIGRPV